MADDSNRVIRVLIAEDHTIVREGLKALLAARSGIDVIAEVGNATPLEHVRPILTWHDGLACSEGLPLA